MCQILCEPQRPRRFKNKDNITLRFQTAESAEERGGWVNVSDTLRTSASSAVQEQRQYHFEISNRRERRGTRRIVNVSDTLRTSASSAVKKQRQNS